MCAITLYMSSWSPVKLFHTTAVQKHPCGRSFETSAPTEVSKHHQVSPNIFDEGMMRAVTKVAIMALYSLLKILHSIFIELMHFTYLLRSCASGTNWHQSRYFQLWSFTWRYFTSSEQSGCQHQMNMTARKRLVCCLRNGTVASVLHARSQLYKY